MTSIFPLFKVIPSFGLPHGSGYRKHTFLNAIKHDHWLRFESYACRIRRLSGITDTSLDNVHDFVYLRIVQYLCGRPLLPRLSLLSVTSCPQILPIFLSPTLLGVEILGNHRIPGTALLQSIFDGCPAIQNFTYCGSLSEQSCQALKYASSLRRLSIRQPEQSLKLPERFCIIQLKPIASLNSLQELSLSFWKTSALSLPADMQTFRDLQSLSLEIPSTLILSFFKACCFDSLRILVLSLQITESHGGSLEVWQEIVSSVGRWGNKLCEISFSHLVRREPSTLVTGTSYLRPLLDNCRLRKLIVDNDLVSLWSDSDILHMMSVWPDLQILRLVGYVHTSPHRRLATVEALKYVAKGLPQLQRLEMPIDLSHLSLDSLCTRASHNLKYLHVGGIITGRDLIPIAHHLHALFPTLSLSFPKHFGGNDYRRNLERLLYLCQNAC
ncbi:hypothetical protein K443DRAFT_131739 [Laccaria amethystina LaAM-08-1]|uniref:F-box domain-containing protein n=1 Tax=Laccaria amethystina LaAM-08-1 TaxID=1095629 RepID=A0A0C9Y3S4_9AGAR|nr:hypothetical protein K443DRAFT_131739 [Laccaria amethystina LaAM-08-1]